MQSHFEWRLHGAHSNTMKIRLWAASANPSSTSVEQSRIAGCNEDDYQFVSAACEIELESEQRLARLARLLLDAGMTLRKKLALWG